MAKKKTEKQTIYKRESLNYHFNYDHFKANDVEFAVASFIERHPLFKHEDVWMEIGYSHSYYDSIEIEVSVHGNRLETDEEYAERLAKEEAKRVRDAENSRKARVAAKAEQIEKDKQDYIRLTKKFTGEDIDPNSI